MTNKQPLNQIAKLDKESQRELDAMRNPVKSLKPLVPGYIVTKKEIEPISPAKTANLTEKEKRNQNMV